MKKCVLVLSLLLMPSLAASQTGQGIGAGSGSGNSEQAATQSQSTTKDGKTVPVKEEVLNVETTGPATHELHISKPDGWPVGDYTVEVMQDDKVVQTKKFSVK